MGERQVETSQLKQRNVSLLSIRISWAVRWVGENEQLNYYYALVLGCNTLVTADAKGSSAAGVRQRKGLGNPSWAFLRPLPLARALPCVPNVLTLLRSCFVPSQGTPSGVRRCLHGACCGIKNLEGWKTD